MNKKQDISKFFKILSHPTRLDILNILRSGEACVCHINAVLGQRQAYISQQLAALREGGIVLDRKDGWNVYYRVSDERIYEILDQGNRFLDENYQWQAKIYQPEACPCPICNS